MKCECGCKMETKMGNKFINGHNSRTNNPMKNPKIAKKLKGISTWNKGKKIKETLKNCKYRYDCDKLGRFVKGGSPWNKGLKGNLRCIYDREILYELRDCSCGCGQVFRCSKKSQKRYVHGHNIRGKTRREIVGEEKAKVWTEKTRQAQLNLIERGLKKTKYFDTKPELKMQTILESLSLSYIKQKRVGDITISDFYIPFSDLYIFVDGNYWHNYPNGTEKDNKKNCLMSNLGYKWVRFWESDINNNINKIKEILYENCRNKSMV